MHELMARLRRHSTGNEGFTLIELVVTVAILGIVVVALSEMVISYFKTTVDTSARLTESHDVQFASAYWQRDVASIGVRSTTYCQVPTDPGCTGVPVHSFPLEQSVAANGNTGVTAACSMPAGTSKVVTLAWSAYLTASPTDPPTTMTVTYVTKPSGSRYELLRVRCTASTQNSVTSIADNLDALPNVSCPGGCNGSGTSVPSVVTMGLSARDPEGHGTSSYTATLTGERRQT